MRINFINSRETSVFGGVSIRYFQIGEEIVTFGKEISEGDSVKLSGSRLVATPEEDNTFLINLMGHSIFLTSGEILLKGAAHNNRISALLKVPINEWVLTYNAFDDEYTLFYFTDKVEWERGINADAALSFYGIEFPIEVKLDEEGDE